MSFKKMILCFVLSIFPALTFAQSDLTVFNSGDITANFTINNKPCEETNSCSIAFNKSVVLAEQQLARICKEQSNVCNIVFGVENRPAPIATAKYTIRDGITEVVSPQPCKFCVEKTNRDAFTIFHRVI